MRDSGWTGEVLAELERLLPITEPKPLPISL